MSRKTSFKGKTVLVTGAASGMGKLAASRYAEAGKTVLAVDINDVALKKLEAEYKNVHRIVLDITDYEAVSAAVKKAEKKYGVIERLVNCAGIMPLQKLDEQDVAVIHKIMDINYKGTVNINLAVLKGMKERNVGEIINFASVAGWIPTLYFGAYDASKFAVRAFTEVLYHELRKTDIRVCCVCPPPVNTPLLNGVNFVPKILKYMETIQPEQVIDAMERSVARKQLYCFPGRTAGISVLVSRLFPALPWAFNHLVEDI